jgi:hypothetical protein
MRALKILVVAMGLVLVLGSVALVIAVATRVNHPPSVPGSASAASEIDLPAGARVSGSETSGDRLVVRVALPDGGDELLIFNLTTGARVAAIILRPKPSAP